MLIDEAIEELKKIKEEIGGSKELTVYNRGNNTEYDISEISYILPENEFDHTKQPCIWIYTL